MTVGQQGESREGYRLDRLEVYNWGTFHERVWTLNLRCESGLLTGDIGSGKSTLVDALTTLLVPSQRLAYNRAAGADARERTLRSYVLGHYKSERGEGAGARPVALRETNTYSVILARFVAESLGAGSSVTIAQVFWPKDIEGQPARFFVVAEADLSTAEHFAGFGENVVDLKKRLRKLARVEVHETFPPYGASFRRKLGIDGEQALDLFHQTVSMKSVGSLTEFVREHMLPPLAIEPRVDALIVHFDDLNRAHEAVLKAKAQIDKLDPLVIGCRQIEELRRTAAENVACRDALRPWFGAIKVDLLRRRIASLDGELDRLKVRIDEASEREDDLRRKRDDVKQAIFMNGGDRLERLRADIKQKTMERDARHQKASEYLVLGRAVELPAPVDADAFADNVRLVAERYARTIHDLGEIQNEVVERKVAFGELRREHSELATEVASLRRRRSNLPSHTLAVRAQLCAELGIREEALPFVGELIEVRSDAREWEGAIERLLHGFALSLLVPSADYGDVSAWVDRTHLGQRLVYFRVQSATRPPQASLGPSSLVRKLSIKPDSAMYPWLDAELARRFDYACATSLEEFRREKRAITRNGQIKGSEGRHEKDDRHRIDDRSRYVLGWSNKAKIEALEQKAKQLEGRMQDLGATIAAHEARQRAHEDARRALEQLTGFKSFREIDWKPLVVEISELDHERQRLESESDALRVLEAQLTELEADIKSAVDTLKDLNARSENQHLLRKQAQDMFEESAEREAAASEEVRRDIFPHLVEMRSELLEGKPFTVESCDARERELRDALQSRIDALGKRADRLRDSVVADMQAYRNAYPIDTQEVDATLEAAPEYAAMLDRLRSDDLPRFEVRFKELLNENTIREVANFQSQLHRERHDIKERIEIINGSLRALDYNPGRFVVLEVVPATDVEVRDFQAELRACTEGAIGGAHDDAYSEEKFLQVKRIIERFRGREGSSDADRRWTRKVTDVRNWFTFAASERWRENDKEHEHYADTGGKSGGQKEKLAYTVLAASIAYQFGIEKDVARPRAFRCVVIDEAFGRGSDESARYGLELFQNLRLQLLIVTPLQKIHVIEPYVAAVGFVHNEDGRRSMLRNLTIEEYRAERAVRAG
ncbi:MAG: ATP-dependent exonuclease SbcCD, C subunit-like protein [Labilithrix sp.]|nr:ATP-dependent exonuclease SbcCD, C subunit-like protein [Labilithrix sp.]